MIIAVMPLCLRTFGSVRTVASPRWQITASLVHTFCPLTTQPSSTRLGLGGNRRRIRAGAGLTEQLAPPQLTLEARPDQSLDLLGAAVLQQRRHHPFAESQAGFVQPVQGVLDDQLLDAVRGPSVRRRPVWLQITAARPEPLAVIGVGRLEFARKSSAAWRYCSALLGQVYRLAPAHAVASAARSPCPAAHPDRRRRPAGR